MSDASQQNAVLRFEDVGYSRAEVEVFDGLSGSVPGRSITVIVGPSGAGKTSLLRLCNRLDVPSRGRILYRGRDVAELDPLELRRRVGLVFQIPHLLPRTVRDNLTVAAPNADQAALEEVLDRVGLATDLLDRRSDRLSGGEAQRVCLARTLITLPDVLLADEPTSALDPTPKLAFERLIRRLTDQGLTVLWVTHDVTQLRRLADHVLVLLDGRIRYEGTPNDLDRQPQLSAFLEGEMDASS